MDHNEFDFIEDLVNPFKAFIRKIDDGKKRSNKPVAQKEEIKEPEK
jgi:hypothetical protein